jgi:hypothetical protein
MTPVTHLVMIKLLVSGGSVRPSIKLQHMLYYTEEAKSRAC